MKLIPASRDRFLVGLLTTVAVFLFLNASADAAKPRCTIKGTKGPDRLIGTPKRDVICGFGGNDVLIGRGGNDILRGGPGKDILRGGPGNDRLLGQPQSDRLHGGPGNDYLDGGTGRNFYFTGPGKNRCRNTETDTATPGCDDTAPTITELTVDRTSIDTSTSPQTVKVTIRVTDDLAGLRGAPTIEAYHAATQQRLWFGLSRTSGDTLDGRWEGELTLPRYAPRGRYGFYPRVVDRQRNIADLNPTQLKRLGLSDGFDQTGAGDQKGPEFKSFQVDRISIDTSASGQTVNFRLRVTDDLAGIGADPLAGSPVQVILEGEAGEQRQVMMKQVSGDRLDGVYEGSLTFPRYTPKAAWNLRLGAIDLAGNLGLVSYEELVSRGLPSRIAQIAPGDAKPPVVRSLSVSPDEVDTSTAAAFVTATFRVTDDLSGTGPDKLGVCYQVDETFGHCGSVTQVSGTDRDGIYQGELRVPEGLPSGVFTLELTVVDNAENIRMLSNRDLLDLGFEASFRNISTR